MKLLFALRPFCGVAVSSARTDGVAQPDLEARTSLVAAILTAVMPSLGYVVVGCTQAAGYLSFGDVMSAMLSSGLTRLNVVCAFASFFTTFVLLLMALACAVRRRRDMQKLVLQMYTWSEERQHRTSYYTAILVGLNIIGSLIYVYPNHMMGADLPCALRILVVASWSISLFYGLFPPFVACVDDIACTLMTFAAQRISHWSKTKTTQVIHQLSDDNIRESMDESKGPERGAQVNELIDEANALLEFIDALSSAFGSFLFHEVTRMLLLSITLALFVASARHVVLDDNNYTNNNNKHVAFRLTYAGACVCYFGVAALRIWRLASLGQGILNELKLAKRSSQLLRAECDEWLSSKQKTRLDHLSENLCGCEGVAPLSFFVLDRPSTLSAVGLLATYFVVLLQFDAAG